MILMKYVMMMVMLVTIMVVVVVKEMWGRVRVQSNLRL